MEERNLGLLSVNDISEASFADAAGMWLSTRHHHLAPRTYKDYANYIATLAKHFGRTKSSVDWRTGKSRRQTASFVMDR